MNSKCDLEVSSRKWTPKIEIFYLKKKKKRVRKCYIVRKLEDRWVEIMCNTLRIALDAIARNDWDWKLKKTTLISTIK